MKPKRVCTRQYTREPVTSTSGRYPLLQFTHNMEWSKQVLTEFINMYRERPCLWQITHPSYLNKNIRRAAQEDLVQFFHKNGYKDVDIAAVRNKLQNLRCAFRKELKKIETAEKEGTTYAPTLWYFNLLMFTKSQTASDADPCTSNYSDNSENHIDNSSQEGQGDTNIPPKKCKEEEASADIPREIGGNASTSNTSTHPSDALEPDEIYEFVKVCTQLMVANRNPDENESFSAYCAVKLRSMSSTQEIYAEHLIHKIITKGMLNTLTEHTDVVDSID